ncbi:hypothetical protein Q4555_15660 [Octadecabacter sp. 1_MG-2023]|uniref:hypothetical protein n=1 Tax=unclassified Octadecabacter TaxID=196158 RepID=UPI001C09442E|nr:MULTISPECIES: hypothetical protein [unclassified Octadecabacter]MBU2994033.1 hypothetical protein [Octadecabacter sp. B2R22]MDO6736115.1 hypothetical protein [Octadecabacter sp. 1_MG-2023]
MRNGWSPHSSGPSHHVVNYLTSTTFTSQLGRRTTQIVRDPAPETLRGDPNIIRAFIDALETKHSYACSTLSFAPDDIDLVAWAAGDETLRAQISVALDLWEDVAFAGIVPECRPPLFANTHTHTGRLEVNVLAPRAVIRRKGDGYIPRAHNPCPPSGVQRNVWDYYQGTLNQIFGWADPYDPSRATRVSGPDWIMKRAAVLERWLGDPDQDLVASFPDINMRFPNEPAPVKIMYATRAYSRTAAPSRSKLLAHLQPILDDLDWVVDLLGPDSIVFRDRKSPETHPFILSGTLCAEHPAEPSADAIALRNSVLVRAPDNLYRAMAKCAEYNRTVLGPEVVNLPAPGDVIKRLRKGRPERRTIAQMVRDTAEAVVGVLKAKTWPYRRNTALGDWCRENGFANSRNLFTDLATSLSRLPTPSAGTDHAPQPNSNTTSEDFTP